MSKEQRVRAVLEADPLISNEELSHRLGCSREAVRGVRCGLNYKKVLPELPREYARGRRCFMCVQWHSTRYHKVKCLLNFPESQQPDFAMECNFYQEAK